LLAVSYANGSVKLFNYPAIDELEKGMELTRVSSFAARMAFSCDNSYLFVLDAYTGQLLQFHLRIIVA
jgi:hypothetical protein